jgi:hypothetical protein
LMASNESPTSIGFLPSGISVPFLPDSIICHSLVIEHPPHPMGAHNRKVVPSGDDDTVSMQRQRSTSKPVFIAHTNAHAKRVIGDGNRGWQ